MDKLQVPQEDFTTSREETLTLTRLVIADLISDGYQKFPCLYALIQPSPQPFTDSLASDKVDQ